MRLQVSVHRHSLPNTNILFTTNASVASHTRLSSATISDLLLDINDLVPLESVDGEWGLEDYVLEVQATADQELWYECLHFQNIESILREDDEVVIRPLSSDELRVRRLGGRIQISGDGRHLVDGVGFGKKWLRSGDRPGVKIPPRKKRRLDTDGLDNEEQDLLAIDGIGPGYGLTTYGDEDEDDDDDPDYEVGDEEDEDSEDDEQDIAPLQITATEIFDDADAEDESSDHSESDDELPEMWEELKDFLENPPSQITRDESLASRKFHRPEKRKRADDDDGHEVEELEAEAAPDSREESDFDGFSTPQKPIQDAIGGESPAMDSLVDSNSETTDDEIVMAKAAKTPGEKTQILITEKFASEDTTSSSYDASSIESSETSDLETSGSGSSASDSGSDSDSDISSSTTSEETSSDDDEELKESLRTTADVFLGSKNTSASSSTAPTGGSSSLQSRTGQGTNRTHSNNLRVKKKKRLQRLKSAGLLPSSACFADMYALDAADQNISTQALADTGDEMEEGFERRKRELIESLQENEAPPEEEEPEIPESFIGPIWENTGQNEEDPKSVVQPEIGSSTPAEPINAPSSVSEQSNRRARLDLASSRRLLFGSLGLKNPKTPEDEQKLREKLAKNIKSGSGRIAKEVLSAKAQLNDETDSWKDKIILTAVECEYDGSFLKPPPFPFQQGWDEDAIRQGKSNWKKTGDQSRIFETYENTTKSDHSYNVGFAPNMSFIGKGQMSESAKPTTEESQTLSAGEVDADDIPPPASFDVLDFLEKQDATPGAIIAFKELHMSKETNWEPQISPYRVARVLVVDNGGQLHLMLSKKDRIPPPITEYDVQTGEEVYSKFEMPGDTDVEIDSGEREVFYEDLIEPRVVEKSAWQESARNEPRVVAQDARSSISQGQSEAIPESTYTDVMDNGQNNSPAEKIQTTHVDVSTPRRKEITKIIKEAGFDSALDDQLLEPITSMGAASGQEKQDYGSESNYDHQDQSPESHDVAQARDEQSQPGCDSYVLNECGSSPPRNPVDAIPNLDGFDDRWQSSERGSQFTPKASEMSASIQYPKLSQLQLDQSNASGTNRSSHQDAQRVAPAILVETRKLSDQEDETEALDLARSDGEDKYVSEDDETRFNSFKSTVPASINAVRSNGSVALTDSQASNPFLGGRDGHEYSDLEFQGGSSNYDSFDDDDDHDDDFPSVSEITSSQVQKRRAKSRSIPVSPPFVTKRSGLRSGSLKGQPDLRFPPSRASRAAKESSQHSIKLSQSQEPHLSQIAPKAQVVDLTISSDPPATSDGDSDRRHESRTQSSKGNGKGKRASQTRNGSVVVQPMNSNSGLGNRRLLTMKAKSVF